ncbi:hypothetical protein VKT23_015161 [Stygiomarasmius scandens]|uniref:Uncharacterized protein n=1 Tax=Marasmiellus scandens TaxID=2682957 RepID=A0ABR1J3B4_9AGAR
MPIDLNISTTTFDDWLREDMHELIGEAFYTAHVIHPRWTFKDRVMPESDSRTLFEQGIQEGDVIHVTYEELPEWKKATVEERTAVEIITDERALVYKVQANHDWDGQMNHPRVKGRLLRKGERFLVSDFDSGKRKGWIRDLDRDMAYLPTNFVSVVSSTELPRLQGSTETRPKLPPFDYPKASPMEFRVNVADRGHSLVNISLEYDSFSSPDDSTRVRVKIYCQSFSTRRISAIGLRITIPGNKVAELQPKDRRDSEVVETKYDSNDRDTTKWGFQGLGVNLPSGVGVDIDMEATREKERGINYHGTQHSSKEIKGSVLQSNTVSWTFKEAVNGPGGSGLDGESGEMWFELSGKPDRFEYDCLVAHIKDRKEKVKHAVSRSYVTDMITSLRSIRPS